MTTLVINGKKVTVSDNFTNMTPEEQNRVVDEIAQSMGAASPAPQAAAPTTPAAEAPQYSENGVPMNAAAKAEIMAKAKAGTLLPSPESAGQHAGASSLAESRAGQGPVASFMGNLAPGLTFGLADEIGAGIGSLAEGRPYDEVLSGLRDQEAYLDEANPKAALAGELTGSLAGIVPGAGWAGKAMTLPGAMFRGAVVGAGQGGLHGFGTGEGGLDPRLQNAGIEAVLGGALGAAIPGAGAGLKGAWRAGTEAFKKSRIGANVGRELGISPSAGRVLSDMIGGEDEAALRAALARSGQGAMLADVSPQATGMLDMAMRSPIPAARTAGKAVEARAGDAYSRVTSALDTAMGVPAGIRTAQGAIVKGSAPARKAAYDAAYSMPIDYSAPAGARLLDELTSRIPPQAIAYANRLMATKGEKSAQIMASFADDGKVTFTRPPDVRQWDYIKQGLDMLAETGDGAGALGGQTRMGAAYQGLARDIRDAVGEAVPEYKAALSVASDAISERNAVEFGGKLLRTTTTPEMAKEAIEGASEAELVAMRQGVRSQLDNILGDVRKVASDQNLDARQVSKAFGDLSSRNAETKLSMLMGDAWPALKAQLDEAGAALGLRARTSPNSATFGRGAAETAVAEEITPGALRRGKPVEALKNLLATGMGASPEAIKRLRDDVKGELADVLTRQGAAPNQAIDSVLAALAGNQMNPKTGTAARKMLEVLMFGGVPSLTGALRGQIAP